MSLCWGQKEGKSTSTPSYAWAQRAEGELSLREDIHRVPPTGPRKEGWGNQGACRPRRRPGGLQEQPWQGLGPGRWIS